MKKVKLNSEAQQAISGGWIYCAGVSRGGQVIYEVVEDSPYRHNDRFDYYRVFYVVRGKNINEIKSYIKDEISKHVDCNCTDELTREKHQLIGEKDYFKTVRFGPRDDMHPTKYISLDL